MKENGFKIIIDTREKKPYCFEDLNPSIEIVREALPAGDYSLAGFSKQVTVERKTLKDFINTMIHNRKRFQNELRLMEQFEDAIIVIEASFIDLLEANKNEITGATTESLLGSTLSLILDFKINVFFAHDRQCSLKFVYEYLKKFAKRHGVNI